VRRRPAALAVVAVLAAGCGLRAPRALKPATAEGLLGELAARRAAVVSLRARARLRTGVGGLWVREAVLVRRPDAVRVDVLSPFGLALAMGAQGDRLWAYPPSERTRYEGPATPENLTRVLGVPIGVADVVDVLLGLPPARTPTGRAELTTRGQEYRLRLPLADGAQTIWFAGDTLAVVRAEETHPGSTLTVAFGDYRDGFPHSVEVGATPAGAGARLAYDTVEPNAPLDPSFFAPPPASRVLPIEAAGRPPG
jgi:hypothetical protein